MNIRRLLTAAVLATGIAAFAGPAFASPMGISGTIDVSGLISGISMSGGMPTIGFKNPGNIDSVSGSFDELISATSTPTLICAGCVTLGTPLSSAVALPFTLFNGANNNNSVALSITSDTFFAPPGGGYDVYGTGWVSLNGYATTLASYNMSIPDTSGGASFDIFTKTPEPGALALFGAGLLGCALFISRRRRATKPQA